jgi:hypothetical protein
MHIEPMYVFLLEYIVTCISDYRLGLDCMIMFIDTLYNQLELNKQYSAIAH